MPPMSSPLRALPSVARLLETPPVAEAVDRWGRETVVAAIRDALDALRAAVRDGAVPETRLEGEIEALPARIAEALASRAAPAYPSVINATGVLLHTNLGRAPLGERRPTRLASYLALEYDLDTGRRGQRLDPIRRRLAEVAGAPAAVMVNNNAGAVLLLLAAHAAGREVIVSRGQLIEIGGSFRLPDVMAASGARLVEVGCTNRTHLADYEAAIGEATAAILVAHPSNYRIVGFTAEPPLDALAALAHERGVPLFMDQGSGALHDMARWGLPHEPTVREILDAGADAVCFSGDKLLGGPQAGIVVGSPRWVEPLARHPLLRALRPDKTALVHMDRVLEAHRTGRLEAIPLYALLGTPVEALRRRARRLARRLAAAGIPAEAAPSRATLGGGTTPEAGIPSWAVALPGEASLAAALRRGAPAVVGRLHEARLLLDLRSVFPAEDRELERAVIRAYQGIQASQDGGA